MNKNSFFDRRYKLIALFFVFLQILIIFRNIYDSYINFFWFCDFTPILIAIGFWKKDSSIIRGIVNVIFFPQMVYLSAILLGTLVYPLTNFSYMYATYGSTDHLSKGVFFLVVTIFTHLTSLIALIVLIKEKPERKSLKYSSILIMLVLLITLTFTNFSENINYVYSFGEGILSFLLWGIIVFFIIAIPTYKLQKFLYWINKKLLISSI